MTPALRSWRNWYTRTFEGRMGNREGSSPSDLTIKNHRVREIGLFFIRKLPY